MISYYCDRGCPFVDNTEDTQYCTWDGAGSCPYERLHYKVKNKAEAKRKTPNLNLNLNLNLNQGGLF